MRRISTVLSITLLLVASVAWAEAPYKIVGDYIEARSNSVYAGPCHYEGEFSTSGREATLVWHIREGSWNETSLDGLTVAAVIVANANLAVDVETRRSVIYIDANATPQQAEALQHLVATHKSELVGQVVASKRVPIQYTKVGLDHQVKVGDVLSLTALSYPCHHCTEKPYQVWYKPFDAVEQPVVGKTVFYEFRDKVLNATWRQTDESNSVFVAAFSI